MIGDRVFYINQMNKSVCSGILQCQAIADTGYLMNTICIGKGEKQRAERVEAVLTFAKKEDAIERLFETKPLIDKAIEITDWYNKDIQLLREDIIGKPQYKDFMEG